MTESDIKHLKFVVRHIDNVRASCRLLGERLIDVGEYNLGLQLIANGQIHDCSKLHGIEWLYLRPEFFEGENSTLAGVAIQQHINTNFHHPECWYGIENMPRIYVAEMVIDWSARSNEFGNDLRDWIKDKATKKYKMTVQSKVYKEIKGFVDILLDPKFK
jgi:hypothetical protein